MHIKRVRPAILLVLLSLLVVMPVSAQDEGNYEEADCPFPVATVVVPNCGYVTVPEVHAEPDGDTIRVAVAVYESLIDDPAPEPIVLAQGGPGGSTLESFGSDLGILVDFLVNTHDVVLIEQRGTFHSEPSLMCQELIDLSIDLLDDNITLDESFALEFEATDACRTRLIDEGVNLDAFDSIENAADVPVVMDALGYTGQFNYYGVSYGTMVAQHLLRDHGERVRAAILDAVVPLDQTFLMMVPQTFQGALDTLFAECAADAACNAIYPDLETTFFDVVAQLDAEPITVTISDPDLPGETYEVFLDGDGLITLTFSSMYSLALQMPSYIYAMADGDFSWLEQVGGFLLIQRTFASGMYNSVICAEDGLDYAAEDVSLEGVDERIADAMAPTSEGFPELCAAWDVEQLGDFADEPITTDIPVITLSGQFDPITPPSYADPVIANMSNVYNYVFPGVGHGSALFGGDCARNIIGDFLADPTQEPDSSCIEAQTTINFTVPASGEVALTEFTSDQFGITGLIPEGWEELAPGTYAESFSSTTALIVQAAPVGADDLLNLLAGQLGIDSFGDPIAEREANGYSWAIYDATAQGQRVLPAVADADGLALLVMLITTEGDADFFTGAVLEPVIDSVVPIE